MTNNGQLKINLLPWPGMVFTTHKNGDDLGMAYGLGFTTLNTKSWD